MRGSRGGYGGTLGPLLGSFFRHMLDGSLISPFPPCCFLRRFVGNGLPVLYPLPLPPVPGNVPMGTGYALTHLGLGRELEIDFFLVVNFRETPNFWGFFVFLLTRCFMFVRGFAEAII